MPHSKKLQNIPLHTHEFKGLPGFKVEVMDEWTVDAVNDKELLQAHRDDHYILILHESGQSTVMIDFVPLEMRGLSTLFIMPGQVTIILLPKQKAGLWRLMRR